MRNKGDLFDPNGFDYVKVMLAYAKPLIVSTPICIRGGLEFTEEMFKALSKRFPKCLPTVHEPKNFFHTSLADVPSIILMENHFGGVDTVEYAKALKKGQSCCNSLIYVVARRTNQTLENKCAFEESLSGVIYASTPVNESANRIYKDYREHLERLLDTKQAMRSMPNRTNSITFMDAASDGKIFSGYIVEDLLRPIGLNEKHVGTHYAGTMISLGLLGCSDKISELYRLAAMFNNTTPQSVEKALRYAIEQAWTHGTAFMQHFLFGNTIDPEKGKPTNAEFISMVIQHIKDSDYSHVLTYKQRD